MWGVTFFLATFKNSLCTCLWKLWLWNIVTLISLSLFYLEYTVLAVMIDAVHHIWKVFIQYFFKYSFSLCFRDLSLYLFALMVFHISLRFYSLFFILSPQFFKVDNLNWLTFHSLMLPVQICYCDSIIISFYFCCTFNSRIYIWLLFIISNFLLILFIC